jgi:hypothetical protein
VAALDYRLHEAIYKPQTSSKETVKFQTFLPPPVGRDFSKEIISSTRENYSRKGKEEPSEIIEVDLTKTPLPAPPLEMPRREKVMHYLKIAAWLTSSQLVELCFNDLASDNAKSKAVSEATSRLESEGELESFLLNREKICFIGRRPNARDHDFSLRDLFVKIINANYKITDIQFCSSMTEDKDINPDLIITFEAEDGSPIRTFWEYDNSTERDGELLGKLARYEPYYKNSKVIFVFRERERLEKFAPRARDTAVFYSVLEEITSIKEPIFFNAANNGDAAELKATKLFGLNKVT